jgi:hypothetical protein
MFMKKIIDVLFAKERIIIVENIIVSHTILDNFINIYTFIGW